MLSKSQYVKFLYCQKRFWLYKNKYNEQTAPSDFAKHLFSQGKEVGVYAYKYFPKGVLVENAWQNPPAALAKTKELLKTQNYIYEAAFQYNNLIVFVDILEKNKDGSYNIIEVKSSTNYRLSSIKKCIEKYKNYLSTPYVLHSKDIEVKDGLVFLPLYMTPFL